MLNKQQIEEMAKTLYDYCSHYDDCVEGSEEMLAKYLIEQGWIKPNENRVVLTKEEYEVLKIKEKEKQIKEIARVTCKLKCKYCENCYHLRQAEALYNAKCRILTEDSVVLIVEKLVSTEKS